MTEKNTDTVPAMLTPGEFVIKRDSAKKIGYDKLNKINKTGKINTKKEAKMPQGKGTYGSKVGRPKKKKWKTKSRSEKYRGAKVRFATGSNEETRSDTSGIFHPDIGEFQDIRHTKKGEKPTYESRERTSDSTGKGRWKKRSATAAKALGKTIPTPAELDKYYSEAEEMQAGGRVPGMVNPNLQGSMLPPPRGQRGMYSKGGKVTSEGYPIHGQSKKYKVGE